MTTESLRAVRDHLSEVVDRVERQHERVIITRNGRAAAVVISPEDLAQLEETIDVLSDPAALTDIREARRCLRPRRCPARCRRRPRAAVVTQPDRYELFLLHRPNAQ